MNCWTTGRINALFARAQQQKAMLQTAAFQVVLELAVHVIRQFLPVKSVSVTCDISGKPPATIE